MANEENDWKDEVFCVDCEWEGDKKDLVADLMAEVLVCPQCGSSDIEGEDDEVAPTYQ